MALKACSLLHTSSNYPSTWWTRLFLLQVAPLLPFGPYTGFAFSQTNRLCCFYEALRHCDGVTPVCAAPRQTFLCNGELQGRFLASLRATIIKHVIFGTVSATSSSCLSLALHSLCTSLARQRERMHSVHRHLNLSPVFSFPLPPPHLR
jgi:hypothetical protein